MKIKINTIAGFFILLFHFSVSGSTQNSFTVKDTIGVSKSIVKPSGKRSDSTRTADTIKVETIKFPLLKRGNSFILNKDIKKYNDYRSSSDILTLLPYSFYQNPGSYGQPGVIQVFGLSNGDVSYSTGGILLNNRWKSSYNTYFINSESYDSLEYFSISSGFLYNRLNNPVHINIIGKNRISERPYSMLRFHQAPEEEGSVDLIFKTPLFSNTYFFTRISNSATDSRGGANITPNYNTNFSLWNVETSFSYLFDESWLLEVGYQYIKDSTEYNGGVIENENMFEARNATVTYNELFQRTTEHNFSLKLDADLFDGAKTYLSVYHRYSLQEYRQNSDTNTVVQSIPVIVSDNSYNSFGITLRQIFDYQFVNFDVIGNYERTDYKSDRLFPNSAENIMSLSGRLTFDLFDKFFPSFYAKTSNIRKIQFTGLGAEANLSLTDEFSLFGGISFFESPYSIIESELMQQDKEKVKQKITTAEIKANYSGRYLNASLGYFLYKNDASAIPVVIRDNDSLVINEISYFDQIETQRSGLNLTINLKVWKLLLSTNSNYYLNHSSNQYYSIPEFTSYSGFYYVDSLFDSNLFLKAGINFKVTGIKSYVEIDNENTRLMYFESDAQNNPINPIRNERVPLSSQIDLFIAGTIQESATVYFVFENLLDEQYYIIPYYPMYPMGLRFGISWEFLD
jgi:hypothetical protein